jgi:hypothetical protein
MLIKHHALEAYYLQRRLELLTILDQFATRAFEEEDFFMDDDHWQIKLLEKEYSDVMNPEDLCLTLKRIYPEHLFGKPTKKS